MSISILTAMTVVSAAFLSADSVSFLVSPGLLALTGLGLMVNPL